jgi:protein TonB
MGGDGEYLPIVKVAPVYPRRALERGITGDLPGHLHRDHLGTVKAMSAWSRALRAG